MRVYQSNPDTILKCLKSESCFQELHRIGNSPARPSEAKHDVGTAIVFPALNLNLDCLELRNHALFRSDPTYDEGSALLALPAGRRPYSTYMDAGNAEDALTERLTE